MYLTSSARENVKLPQITALRIQFLHKIRVGLRRKNGTEKEIVPNTI